MVGTKRAVLGLAMVVMVLVAGCGSVGRSSSAPPSSAAPSFSAVPSSAVPSTAPGSAPGPPIAVTSSALTGSVGPTDLSCSSPTFCLATNGGQPDPGFVAWTRTTTNWSAQTTVTPAESDLGFSTASCASRTLCGLAYTLGRDFTHVYVTMWNGSGWGAPTALTDPTNQATTTSLTCVAPQFCLLSDGTYTWKYQGKWGPVGPLPGSDPNSSFGNIACASPTSCLITSHPATDIWNGSGWRRGPGSPLRNNGIMVQCPAATACVAEGATASGVTAPQLSVSAWNGSSWSPPSQIMPSTTRQIEGLQCPAPGNCVAVDNSGRVVTLRSGTWRSAGTLAGGFPKSQGLVMLACPSTTTCLIPDTPGRSVLSFRP